jgi:hypothetical protein
MVTSSPGRNSTRSATPRPNRAGLAALENPTSEPGHHLWQERRHRLARRHVKQTPPLEEHNPKVVACWGHKDGAESNRGGPRAAQFSASVQAGTSTDHRTLIWAGGHAPFSARTGREWRDWGQPAETGPTLRSHAAMVLGSRIAVVWFGG